MAKRTLKPKPASDPADKYLENILQELKVIDIKRKSIRSGRKREPFIYAGLVLAGFPLLVALYSISALGIFICGSIFGAVASQLFGPTGVRGRRAKARDAIDKSLNKILNALPYIDGRYKVRAFGLVSAQRSAIKLTDHYADITVAALEEVSIDGAFFDQKHSHFIAIPYGEAGGLDPTQSVLRGQYWKTFLKRKSIGDEMVANAFNRFAPS